MSRKTAYGESVAPEGPQDTGRMAFREPDEVPDGRPVISRRAFWRDESERLTYEHAVETNPKRPGEGSLAYVQRIAELAAGRLPKIIKPMPKARLTKAQIDARVAELEGQRG